MTGKENKCTCGNPRSVHRLKCSSCSIRIRKEEKEKIRRLDGISKHNRELDCRADYHKGLRTERERILGLIRSDIKYQNSKLTYDFEKDKAILWRITGMKFLINKILLRNVFQ